MYFVLTGCEHRDESTLSLYTSMPERDMQAVVKDFESLHPEVSVTFFRSDTMDLMTRLDTEFLAESPMADVVWISDDIVMKRLQNDDRLQPQPNIDLKAFPKDSLDPEKMFFGTIYQGTGIVCHNTQPPIISFKELLHPAMKDTLVMPSPLFSGAAAFNLSVLTEHEDFGWTFWKELMKNQPLLVKGNGAVIETVSKKGRICGIILDVLALNAIRDGSGLTFSYCEDGVPVIREPIAMLKASTHQKEARLFIDYILSKRGQELLKNLGYRPLHQDVSPPYQYGEAYFKGVPLNQQKDTDARHIPNPIVVNEQHVLEHFDINRLNFTKFLKT